MNAAEMPLPAGLHRLPVRPLHGHKGTFGQVLLIGGSRGFAGAIGLAGMAALRGGAGLVRLAIPDPCLEVVAAFEPSYMTVPLPCDQEGRIAGAALTRICELAALSTCVGCGPGLGRSADLDDLVSTLYTESTVPTVFDADALNALAVRPASLANHLGPRVITPHPGEFARLTGVPASDPDAQARAAAELARDAKIVVVLKGHHTLVADATSTWRNSTGNPGMATGGSGDVLTGLLTALIAQTCGSWELRDTVRLAVHVHGLAGDLGSHELGQASLIASDLIRFLPPALRQVESSSVRGGAA